MDMPYYFDEFATEDIPRKKAFVVRKADRRRSWRIQQGATLRIPADLLEPFLIGLPVGTTVDDDETAIRGGVGKEDLDIVHDLSIESFGETRGVDLHSL